MVKNDIALNSYESFFKLATASSIVMKNINAPHFYADPFVDSRMVYNASAKLNYISFHSELNICSI